MRNVILFFFVCSGSFLFAQNADLVYMEKSPTFPGGDSAFQVFLDSMIVYPDSAKAHGIEGTVYVYFEIGKDGTCANFKVQKGVPGAPDLDREALRVLALMPKWNPGEMSGRI